MKTRCFIYHYDDYQSKNEIPLLNGVLNKFGKTGSISEFVLVLTTKNTTLSEHFKNPIGKYRWL